MQKAKVDNFIDRSIFYTTNLIQDQGIDVDGDWDYLLPEIYFLAIMDFKFDDSHPDHFIHDVRLIEIHTNKEFFPKLSYIFIEMPKFKKTETELESELEEWLYILNNLKQFEQIPVSLREKEEYKKVFEIAEVGNLTPEEMNEYQQSLKIQRDNNATMRYAKKEARAEGLAEGKAEGLAEGKAEGLAEGEHKKAVETAIVLKTKEIAIEVIAEATGLSVEEIQSL